MKRWLLRELLKLDVHEWAFFPKIEPSWLILIDGNCIRVNAIVCLKIGLIIHRKAFYIVRAENANVTAQYRRSGMAPKKDRETNSNQRSSGV